MKKLLLLTLMTTLIGCGSKGSGDNATSTPFAVDTVLTPAEKEARLFTPEIMLKMGRLSGSQLSPNGEKILYTVNYQNVALNSSRTGLWVMDSNGENAVQLTPYDYSVAEPRWNAKGDKIYFLSGGQIYRIDAAGGARVKISDIAEGVNGFEISPDETKIWYASDVKVQKVKGGEFHQGMDKSNSRIYDDLMCRHWDVWEDGAYSHIFVADFNGNEILKATDIMAGEPYDAPGAPYFDNAEITWTPDSKAVAYTCRKLNGYQYAISTNTDIFLYDLAAKTTKNLTEGMMGYDMYPRFSPDGKYMAWNSMERAGNESDKDRLLVMELATGEQQYITAEFDYNASSITWTEDSRTLYFISPMEATHQICKAELGSKVIKVLTEGLHDYISLSLCGSEMIAEMTTLSMATELFKVNLTDGAATQLTFINKNIYDNVDMGKIEKRWVKTTDNKEMLTWVIVPPKAVLDGSVKYPALLYCQGGPQSVVSQFWSYRWNFQVMAAQGYVVVAPNRRGLPSFGQEWLDQISGDYSGQNIDDYFSAIDDVAAEPYVDADNLGCVGASYGGYSVYYIAGKHEGRFKAFISHCGIFDFTSMYGSTEELWFVNNDYGGAYWEKNNKTAQRSYANSPHNFVQNWDTPILIITGAKDFRIPYTQSLEAFTAARALDIPSRLVYFEDEGHQVFGAQNAMVWHTEFFGWLDKYLK
ncbi:MAG: S9 family peptidase [Rikenellaceae bacterium]